MRKILFKIGSLGITLLVLLEFSTGFADGIPDFETMLQEALRANQSVSELATPRSVASPSAKEPQSAPSPGTPAQAVTTRPIASNGSPAVAVRTAAPVSVSGVWTTIEPNAPGIIIPEPQAVLPPPSKLAAEEQAADHPFALTEPNELRAPLELFEPEPMIVGIGETPAVEAGSESLPPDEMFDVEYTLIDENGEDIVEPETGDSDSPPVQENTDNGELETIAEPRKIGEAKDTFPVAPVQPGELSDLFLDNLANAKVGDEPKASESDEPADKSADEPADETEGTVVPEKTQVTITIPDFDSDDDETTWKMIDASLVGDPHATDKLKLMYDEVISGLRTRNISNRYEMWKSFARGIIRDTSGINTRSELDGRSRLAWYQKLYDEPVRSVFETEEYSRELYVGLSGGHRHLAELMPGIRERMDVSKREDAGIRFPLCTTPLEALAEVKRGLLIAASAHARAFSTMPLAELNELEANFANTFVGSGCVNGHTIPARSVGRKHVDMFTKVDTAALYDGVEALIPITNTALLDLLTQLPDDALPQAVMNGQRFQRLSTAAGDIVIGGRGKNTYDLDSPEMRDVICVISFGDDDTFREGTCDLSRPVLLILALGKKNTFVGTKPGIQGGSIMGISMLLDRGKDSTYTAVDVAQGSTMGGVGILINYDGGNKYTGRRRVQGHALLGLGMLIDRGTGNASYKAAMWAQGFGAPGGFGLLSNSGNGNNHYYCGGLYLDSYPEHPGYDGWGQGIGAGIRQVANGGIGVILSGTGDDVYEVDYFGHGGGYWLGVGIARDFGGNDMRHGTTLADYQGRPRAAAGNTSGNGVQSQWTRFANGFGCHYAVGYCFDDGGNDVYGGRIMGTGMAWDLAFGFLGDFSGSGKYTAVGNMTQGVGAEASIGILFSYGGNDSFASRSQGLASTNVTYHPPASGGNFSFLINYGGEDKYGCGAPNNAYTQRGSSSGFLIDRPTESEAATAIVALRQAIEIRNKEIAEYDAIVAQIQEARRNRQQPPVSPPRTPRPKPISETQLISAVPDFGTVMKAEAAETTVK